MEHERLLDGDVIKKWGPLDMTRNLQSHYGRRFSSNKIKSHWKPPSPSSPFDAGQKELSLGHKRPLDGDVMKKWGQYDEEQTYKKPITDTAFLPQI